jgi:hypothetical protein
MEIKINISGNQEIVWPTICTICGLPTREQKGKASLYVVDSKHKIMPWIGWTEKTLSIKYPACSSHSIKIFILSFFTNRRIYNYVINICMSIMLFISFSYLISVIMDATNNKSVNDLLDALIFFIISVSWFAMLIYAKLFLPVKLKKVDDDAMIIEIKNEAYAKEFVALNIAKTTILNDKN